MIELQNVTKVYTGRQRQSEVLHQVDLKIQTGEFVAVMGPSGSGKTTLLNIIGGVDRLTDGKYFFQGIPVHEMGIAKLNTFRKKHVGFIFQEYHLLDDCTIYENVELPLRVRNVGRKERKQKVMEFLGVLHIEEYAKKLPGELSGGEQQRCAIARAMITGNELLLADEPTGALDSSNGTEVMEILSKLNKEQKRTIVMVTHNQRDAAYADRILYIKDGRIFENGKSL